MGYRSDVKIRCKKEDLKYFQEAFDKNEKQDNNGYPLYPHVYKEDDNGFCIITWEYVKWYDGIDKAVTNIMDVVRDLSTKREEIDYVRIGEGCDNTIDYEEICGTSGFMDLGLTYSITGDEDAKEVKAPWE